MKNKFLIFTILISINNFYIFGAQEAPNIKTQEKKDTITLKLGENPAQEIQPKNLTPAKTKVGKKSRVSKKKKKVAKKQWWKNTGKQNTKKRRSKKPRSMQDSQSVPSSSMHLPSKPSATNYSLEQPITKINPEQTNIPSK